MFCKNCGTDIGDASFCPACGVAAKAQNALAKESTETAMTQPSVAEKKLGMKWLNCLPVLMILGALANFGNAMKTYTGLIYEEKIHIPGFEAADMYELCNGLELWDKIAGVFGIIIAVLQIVICVLIVKRKALGPKVLVSLYVLNAVFVLICAFGASSTISSETMYFGNYYLKFSPDQLMSSSFVKAVFYGVFAVINYIYFKKRKHMFN